MLYLSPLLASAVAASPTYHSNPCFEFDVPLSFQALSLEPAFPPFKTHYESVDFLLQLTARNSREGPSPFKGANPNTQINVTIAATYCSPKKGALDVVQLLSHGIGFDSSYWNFGLVTKYPTASDGVVLTGYSANTSVTFLISSNFHLARENSPQRFGNLSTGYLTWGDELSHQFSFLHWPKFSPEVLAVAEKTKQPVAVSELLTVTSNPAEKFTSPVLVVTGQYDRIACENNCTKSVLDKVTTLYPHAKTFESYVQPDTGHGINLHFNATGAYNVITNFVDQYI